jgi:2-dehydro-3-deoxyphosphooctonate aldolase (KDO 8-P synthase)
MVGQSGFFAVVGPCVIESEAMALSTATAIAAVGQRLGITIFYKSSFDKANRSAIGSPRGPGLHEGLRILQRVKAETGLPVLTDVHESAQITLTAQVADVLQIPAFLSRQTDLLVAAMATGCIVNVKKGQFMAPQDVGNIVHKAASALAEGINVQDRLWLTERGNSFGHNDLVVDMRGFAVMRATGCSVLFDATHSVQRPCALGDRSGGDRAAIPALARAAVAAGVDGIFIEAHPDPDRAHSDAATAWPLDKLEPLLSDLIGIDRLINALGY